jgi:hypothetical protein
MTFERGARMARPRRLGKVCVSLAVAMLYVPLASFRCDAQEPGTANGRDPEAIFLRCLQRLSSYSVANYAVYSTTWNVSVTRPEGTTSYQTHNQYAIRTSDNVENATGDEPLREASRKPSQGTLPAARIMPVFVGPFAWSIRAAAARSTPAPMPMQPDLSNPLKTIASVVAKPGPAYKVDLVGTEEIAGHLSYHLVFHPLYDEVRHNLRDLWIDVGSYDLWKAHYLGAYAPSMSGHLSPSDVTVWLNQ